MSEEKRGAKSEQAAGEEAGKGRKRARQSAAPFCQRCGNRMNASGSDATFTRYTCPVCKSTASRRRPVEPPEKITPPKCPWDDSTCQIDPRRTNARFLVFACPKEDCNFVHQIPSLGHHGQAVPDEPEDFSRR